MKKSGIASGFKGFVAALIIAFFVAACSPVFNWREHRFEESAVALLPCKPNTAQRQVPMLAEGAPQKLSMAGCLAGGASFSVSVVAMPVGTTEFQLADALARWELASGAAMKARAGVGAQALVRGAQFARTVVSRTSEIGQPAQTSRAVFARKGLLLMHAQLLGDPKGESDGPSALSVQAAETFFGGLSL